MLQPARQGRGKRTATLITGQTGTGKELFARAIHDNSAKAKGSFVIVDCASLPANLAESTLFGHRRGAFTGADAMRQGLVARADGGSLFLDEIGEMPLDTQRVLLRVLQEKRFRPVGGDTEQKSDFRLIAATNRNLNKEVEEGRFREDLLYRIRGFVIDLPRLAERNGDILELARHFVQRLSRGDSEGGWTISQEYIDMLRRYEWPGNVRELAHAVEHSVARAGSSPELLPEHLPVEIRASVTGARMTPSHESETSPAPASRQTPEADPAPLREFKDFKEEQTLRIEREYLIRLKQAAGGDPAEARRISGLSKSRMYALLKKHGIVLS
ncbi:sigma 54-interacting transcriptional regulator [Salidesulfovibrio brasiliensis]|uniref:sigma 54-interacting transcriptional regulator n=1 Tax=Salidesulfovibrio brasiliensis TaxID=221711 RepID=UPI0006D0BC97|nr:sigma 54-interacting transcriptional regulator [Salidesulfovibrio brasiliensis]